MGSFRQSRGAFHARTKTEERRERRAGRTTRTPTGQSTSRAPALSSGGRRSPCKSYQLRRRKDGVRKACVFHQASLRAGWCVARARRRPPWSDAAAAERPLFRVVGDARPARATSGGGGRMECEKHVFSIRPLFVLVGA